MSLAPDTYEGNPQAEPLSEYHDAALNQPLICQPGQSLIQQLITAYPQGHVFAVDEYGVLEDPVNKQSNSTDAKIASGSDTGINWDKLFECVPNARYILFLPLWHYQREACFATCLAWVSNTGKTLDSGDKNSLTVFGNSLMAEIFRLEALRNTQSKSDFISSMSHELRSPLHGILTTLELMQESTKDSELLSMVEMIESCSLTLLDTFDHLLEFSKINSRTSHVPHADKRTSVNSPTGTNTTKVLVDLASLVDDVVEMVALSHKPTMQMESGLTTEDRNASTNRAPSRISKALMVTAHIERNRNWVIPAERGAWTRIILNICSNAMKYTRSGHIGVALKLLEQGDGEPDFVSFIVTDTGIGMSEEFLKYHLFTPFMQEDNLSPGSGLGLNIVKNIVESLSGKIFVESRQNEGTSITVNIPLDPGYDMLGQPNIDHAFDSQRNIQSMSLGLLSLAAAEHEPHLVSPPEVLQKSIRDICEGRFGMKRIEICPKAPLDLDILLIDTHALAVTEKSNWEALFINTSLATTPQAVVLLGTPLQAIAQVFGLKEAVCVASPITGKRLWAAMNSAMVKATHKEPRLSTLLSNSGAPGVPFQVPVTSMLESPRENDTTTLRSEHHNALPILAIPKTSESPRLLHVSPAGDAAAGTNNTASHARSCRFRRFLLVDDNAINLKVLSAFARRLNVQFCTATNGAEAVRLYRKSVLEEATPFDCIFMDLSMPVLDGFQAVAAIRQFETEQHYFQGTQSTSNDNEVPVLAYRSYILALTGLGSEAARSSARALGFDEFLVKPVRFKDVLPLLLTTEGLEQNT